METRTTIKSSTRQQLLQADSVIQSRHSGVSAKNILAVDLITPFHDLSMLTSSLISSIQEQVSRPGDIFLTLVPYKQCLRPPNKAQLITSLCYQLLIARPSLFFSVKPIIEEVHEAKTGCNYGWTENTVWRCLLILLSARLPDQVFVIIDRPDDSSSDAVFTDLIADLLNLVKTIEIKARFLILYRKPHGESNDGIAVGSDPRTPDVSLQNATGSLGTSHVDPTGTLTPVVRMSLNLDDSRIRDALKADIEALFVDSILKGDHLQDLKAEMEEVILDNLEELQAVQATVALANQYPFLSLNSMRRSFLSRINQNAVTAVLESIPRSIRRVVLTGLLWLATAHRPLTCEEFTSVLEHGDEDDATVPTPEDHGTPSHFLAVSEFAALFCGLVMVVDNCIYLAPLLLSFLSVASHHNGPLFGAKLRTFHSRRQTIALRCYGYLRRWLHKSPDLKMPDITTETTPEAKISKVPVAETAAPRGTGSIADAVSMPQDELTTDLEPEPVAESTVKSTLEPIAEIASKHFSEPSVESGPVQDSETLSLPDTVAEIGTEPKSTASVASTPAVDSVGDDQASKTEETDEGGITHQPSKEEQLPVFLSYAIEHWFEFLQSDSNQLEDAPPEAVEDFVADEALFNHCLRHWKPGKGVRMRIVTPSIANIQKKLDISIKDATILALSASRRQASSASSQETGWQSIALAACQRDNETVLHKIHDHGDFNDEKTLSTAFEIGSDTALCILAQLHPEVVKKQAPKVLRDAVQLGNTGLIKRIFAISNTSSSPVEFDDPHYHPPILHLIAESTVSITPSKFWHKQMPSITHAARDRDGRTPLHLAAISGHFKFVHNALSWLADHENTIEIHDVLNLRDNSGATALFLSSKYGRLSIVEQLLAAGAKHTVCDKKRQSPLHIACQMGYLKIVSALIGYGAKLDGQDKLKKTPLHLALQHHHPEIAMLLLVDSVSTVQYQKVNHKAIDNATTTIRTYSGPNAQEVSLFVFQLPLSRYSASPKTPRANLSAHNTYAVARALEEAPLESERVTNEVE